MIDFSQMMIRFLVALFLGVIIGVEREIVGKEAGIRTCMLVAGGAAIFSLIGLNLPFLIASSADRIPEILERNSGFLDIIGNIVVGVGFLGAGIIIKTEERVHGLTTAATIWTTAAIGVLAGVGLMEFALVATLIIAILLYVLRKTNLGMHLDKTKQEGAG